MLEWGSRGREFKSLHPDHKSPEIIEVSGLHHFWENAKSGVKLSSTNNIANNKLYGVYDALEHFNFCGLIMLLCGAVVRVPDKPGLVLVAAGRVL